MGFNLSPIVVKKQLTLEELRGKSLAVDGDNTLYQFLALIRMRDGRPFTDSQGHVTSHLLGLLMRTTRLMADYDVRPVFVFDGKPPELKMRTLEDRRNFRAKAKTEWQAAVQRGDLEVAWRKAVRMDSLTQPMKEDAKQLLGFLGIPVVQAPQEGEAQAAYMAKRSSVWATNSRDYDSVLFGAPRLVRYVTISGQEFLPSKGIGRPLIPELIELEKLLAALEISHNQLVDLAIMVGTDFNEGIKSVGPKTALKLIRKHNRLEDLPTEYAEKLAGNLAELRKIFLAPAITETYSTEFGGLQEHALRKFLCEERGFSNDRVDLAVKRMKEFYAGQRSSLSTWTQTS